MKKEFMLTLFSELALAKWEGCGLTEVTETFQGVEAA